MQQGYIDTIYLPLTAEAIDVKSSTGRKMSKKFALSILICAILPISACSTVEPIAYAPPIPSGQCNVHVFYTERQAAKLGNFEELCVVSGTSSGSFSHTVQVAIEKHKDKACSCGATHAYIQARNNDPLGLATVTLVGIRYLKQAK